MCFYAIKVIWQSFTLLAALALKRRSSYLILQNPPAIPTIPLCWLYCRITRIQFTIDWHNYAHTIQALGSRSEDAFVKLTRVIEFFFGSKAHSNLCVSKAMQSDLEKKWKIKWVNRCWPFCHRLRSIPMFISIFQSQSTVRSSLQGLSPNLPGRKAFVFTEIEQTVRNTSRATTGVYGID